MAGPTAPGTRPRDVHRPQVLLIDPDRDTRPALAAALAEAGCEVVAALRTGMAAEYAVRQHRPTVIVMDLDLRPGGTRRGLLLVAGLTEEAPTVPVLVVARPGHEDHAELTERVSRAGARRLLSKLDVEGLVAAVRAEHAAFLQAAHPRGGRTAGTPAVRVGGLEGQRPRA